MKKLIFMLMLALGLQHAFAQTRVGIQLGINECTTLNCKPIFQGDPTHFKFISGGYLGLAVDIPLTEKIFLQPQLDLGYEGTGRKGKETYGTKCRTKAGISLPIEVGYRIALNEKYKLSLSAGPFLQCNIGGYMYFDVKEEDGGKTHEKKDWDFYVGNDFTNHGIDYGLQGGITLHQNKFFYKARAKYTLKDGLPMNEYGHTLTLSLGIGYFF